MYSLLDVSAFEKYFQNLLAEYAHENEKKKSVNNPRKLIKK